MSTKKAVEISLGKKTMPGGKMVEVKKVVDLTFPFHVRHAKPDGTDLYKVFDDGSCLRLFRPADPEKAWEILPRGQWAWVGFEDFMTGTGENACSPEEFADAVRRLGEILTAAAP